MPPWEWIRSPKNFCTVKTEFLRKKEGFMGLQRQKKFKGSDKK